MSPITAHVLDTTLGKPAGGLGVRLDVLETDGEWRSLTAGVTDSDGRVAGLIGPGTLEARIYRLTFEVGSYHREHGRSGFYPWVDVVFSVVDTGAHHHIPLLLSPFGYSTYRGS
jgi:5-hydroxyisourate hydrolase